KEPVVLADHQGQAPGLRKVDQLVRALQRLGERLLDQNVEAGLERELRDGGVAGQRRRVQDRIRREHLERGVERTEASLFRNPDLVLEQVQGEYVRIDARDKLDLLDLGYHQARPVATPGSHPHLHDAELRPWPRENASPRLRCRPALRASARLTTAPSAA